MRSWQPSAAGNWNACKNAFDDFAVTSYAPHDQPPGVIADWFTDADETLLPAHTPDKGGVWSVSYPNWYIKTGRAEPRYAASQWQTFARNDAGVSNVDVITDLSMNVSTWPDG